MYFMRKNNVVAKVYDSPFVPPLKSRVEVKGSQGISLNLIVAGHATYRYGDDRDMASLFIDVPVVMQSDEWFGERI